MISYVTCGVFIEVIVVAEHVRRGRHADDSE